jgi:hypothetical protein
MMTGFSHGAGFTLVDTFPQENANNINPQNVAIKLVFSEKISDPVAIAANANSFFIVDEEGNAIEFNPLYNESKYPNEVWLQIAKTLPQDTSYKVTVAAGMQSSQGNVLDEAVTLNFSTRNTGNDSKGYMGLMLFMVVGMMGFTIYDTRRKIKKEAEKSRKEDDNKVNPYKEARRTGKSVEQVVARTEKEKAQAEKRNAKVARRENAHVKQESKPKKPGVYSVKKARPISDIGRQTPKKFIEARMAREAEIAEARNRSRQALQSKSKGSKQQQRKKK